LWSKRVCPEPGLIGLYLWVAAFRKDEAPNEFSALRKMQKHEKTGDITGLTCFEYTMLAFRLTIDVEFSNNREVISIRKITSWGGRVCKKGREYYRSLWRIAIT